jgi:hypothetical protein
MRKQLLAVERDREAIAVGPEIQRVPLACGHLDACACELLAATGATSFQSRCSASYSLASSLRC